MARFMRRKFFFNLAGCLFVVVGFTSRVTAAKLEAPQHEAPRRVEGGGSKDPAQPQFQPPPDFLRSAPHMEPRGMADYGANLLAAVLSSANK